ncbi:hypothetical protein ACOBV9_07750 [Pseudoalteromonas espejiana]
MSASRHLAAAEQFMAFITQPSTAKMLQTEGYKTKETHVSK